MALVAYDNSDSDEFEDDEYDAPSAIIINKRGDQNDKPLKQNVAQSSNAEENSLSEGSNAEQSPNLFTQLPQPSKMKQVVLEEDDEFLHKKAIAPNIVKPKAQITIPSLSDFKDVESTPMNKVRAPCTKKSSLLSLLPQPKGSVISTTTKSLIPHVLTQKPNTTTKKKPLPSAKIGKPETLTKSLVPDSDSDNDDDVQTDFFSINKPVDIPDIPFDEALMDDQTKLKQNTDNAPKGIESYFKKDVIETPMDTQDEAYSGQSSSYGAEHNGEGSGQLVLDDEAIRQLCGSRAKRRKEDIQLVDFDQQKVLSDAREMLLKGLMDDTSQRMSSSKKKGNEPTSMQKRKHQITYLAHQAKANEAELQSQWANNRMNKRKTQSKYGF